MIEILMQIGYPIAATMFLALAVTVATVWRERYRGVAILFATASTAAWCGTFGYASIAQDVSPLFAFVTEITADIAWLWFVASLFKGALSGRGIRIIRFIGVFIGVCVLVSGIVVSSPLVTQSWSLSAILIIGSILTSVSGLIALEQIYRNGRASQRRDLRYLCIGVASIFGVDLMLYSNAVFSGYIGILFMEMRGYVIAMAGVLISFAIHLRANAAPGIFLSRRVVFQASMIVAAGIYLTIVGLAGQLVRHFGQQWGEAVQVVMFSGAAMALAILALSERLRKKWKVLVAKHFFEAKYDYREQWGRLISTLTSTDRDLPLAKRAIQAILHIMDARAGVLWQVRSQSKALVAVSSWDVPVPDLTVPSSEPLVKFVLDKHWAVNLDDLRQGVHEYEGVSAEDIPPVFGNDWLLVPLVHNGQVFGIVSVRGIAPAAALNFEDYDLLKTAGRQIASYLSQEQATEHLAETRQFQAFSKLTAFLMHDLKNTMAQQLLVVQNAEKHRRNPNFVDDAIETIRGTTERIRNVIGQLQQATMGVRRDNIDVGKVLLVAASRSAGQSPVPIVSLCDERIRVIGAEDRLLMAVCHAISNAQDATPADGSLNLEMSIEGDDCVVAISDSGCGMAPMFVRDRLFKAFDSTKGPQGMGIGAYQIRETIREMGGDVTVESTVGEGTTLVLRIPIAGAGSLEAPEREQLNDN